MTLLIFVGRRETSLGSVRPKLARIYSNSVKYRISSITVILMREGKLDRALCCTWNIVVFGGDKAEYLDSFDGVTSCDL